MYDYKRFLSNHFFQLFNLIVLGKVLCVQWTDKLNRSNGFFITWLILLILDGLVMLFSASMLFYSVRVDPLTVDGDYADYFGKEWICWKNKKEEIGVTKSIMSIPL